MTLCDTCPKPGNCCKKLNLTSVPTTEGGSREQQRFWVDELPGAANEWAASHNLPFEFVEEQQRWKDENGREYATVYFGCPKLGTDGRCTIYENRPVLCRKYQAGDDALCVFNKDGTLRDGHA